MKFIFVVFLFLFLYHPVINAQSVDKHINNYVTSSPLENVYLQLDNSLYAPTDTVWFKAYILANTLPSSFSKSLYVDWYNGEEQIISHQVYPVQAGSAFGQFTIPPDYKENNIHLLAYTKWMLNDSSRFLFHKDIQIISPNSESKEHRKKEILPPQKVHLQFFPEGGNLVSSIKNKIAFKATDNYGNPVSVKGVIKNNDGRTVADFTSFHDGMGFFYLVPKRNESYTAEMQTQQDTVSSVPLPLVQPSGLAMEVLLERGSRKIIIRKNVPGINLIHLLVTMDGIVDYLSNITFSGQDSVLVTVPVNDVPPGILTFTVLDDHWNPLAERISFVRNNLFLQSHPEISVIKKDLTKRGYNSFDLHYDDRAIADLSVVVTDADIPADTSSDIVSYLLLAGQLKGKINQPAYYFSDTSRQLQEQLDLVMMTNGWRKYKWKQIIAGVPPQIQYPADKSYFFFSGKVNDQRKLPKEVSFMVKSSEELAGYTLPLMANGSFSDSSMILFDSVTVSYQPDKKRGDIPMTLDSLLPPAFTTYPFAEVLSGSKPDSLLPQKAAINGYYAPSKNLLATVTVFAPQKTEMDKIEDKYASSVFKNENGFRLDLENNPTVFNNNSVVAMLRGRIPNFNDDPDDPPYYFVNEIMMPLDAVEQLPLSDIVFVKYYPRHFVMSPGAGGGIAKGGISKGTVAIYTKKFSAEDLQEHHQEGTYHITGYTIAKEFYSPDYRILDKVNIDEDRRKTLLWKPSLQLGKDHKNDTISFYNNDYAKRFRVIVEGISSDGTLVHEEQTIE